jgi:hypothetical protein
MLKTSVEEQEVLNLTKIKIKGLSKMVEME